MQWFGWLTKGHYEVTLLDRIVGFGEFTVLVAFCLAAWVVGGEVRRQLRRRK